MERWSVVLLVIGAVFMLADGDPADAQEVGRLYHITGCENGVLEVPTPNVWATPQRLLGNPSQPIGRLSGDGRPDQGLACQGAVVRILDSRVVEGGTVFQIESVVNGLRGWITEPFIGRAFPQDQCREFFTDPEHLRRCESP
ncbi:MAG: hypothetical protein WD314_00905 [Trueperaceae bacterium]